MSEPETPQFRVSNEGEPIPPVDPEDLKRRWSTRKQRLTCEAQRTPQSREADRVAIAHRFQMVSMLEGFNHGKLLAPWKHDEELDDAVFRLAATFPMRPLRQRTYMVPGDSMWGFDPNAFVAKLTEETGIPHTWEPVLAKIPEGSSCWTHVTHRVTEHEATHDARELLWAVWSKCQPNLSRASGNHEVDVASVAMLFADFAIDSIDLARKFVSRNGAEGSGPPLAILSELERRATWLDLECSVCQRLMYRHSDEEMARCQQAVPPGTTLYRFRTS